MKTNMLTTRLDMDVDDLLTKMGRRSGRSKSNAVREALQRYLCIYQFEPVRQRMLLFAEARGYSTDEDVFTRVS